MFSTVLFANIDKSVTPMFIGHVFILWRNRNYKSFQTPLPLSRKQTPYYLCQHLSIKSSISDQNELYKLDSLSETQNTSILNAVMEFLISSTLGLQTFASKNFSELKNLQNFFIFYAWTFTNWPKRKIFECINFCKSIKYGIFA